jgi:putative flippase GtrA
VFGATGLSLDFVVFVLLGTVLVPGAANAVSYLTGTVLTYTLNARFGFQVPILNTKRFVMFVSVALLGAGLSSMGIAVVLHFGWLSPVMAKAIVMPPVLVLQYLLNAGVTFKK